MSLPAMRNLIPSVSLAAAAAMLVALVPARSAAGSDEPMLWAEHFDGKKLDWVDPRGHSAAQITRVYSVQRDASGAFLHARYDGASSDRPPAIDLGRAFVSDPPPLDRVRALRWRWRALHQPRVGDDPWLDVAASLYVVVRAPSFIKNGTGFKFGWLAKPGPAGARQAGLLQVALRSDAPGSEWRTESVDLCAMYRREYGPCEGEHVLYVGVMTDGDGTNSLAEADYADFELVR